MLLVNALQNPLFGGLLPGILRRPILESLDSSCDPVQSAAKNLLPRRRRARFTCTVRHTNPPPVRFDDSCGPWIRIYITILGCWDSDGFNEPFGYEHLRFPAGTRVRAARGSSCCTRTLSRCARSRHCSTRAGPSPRCARSRSGCSRSCSHSECHKFLLASSSQFVGAKCRTCYFPPKAVSIRKHSPL